MDRIDRFLGVHADALQLRSERLTLIASNIANAATPGYKARDINFQAALTGAGSGPPLAATSQRHFATAVTAGERRLQYREPVQPSLDGNTVELATEQLQFSENALRYRSTLSMLNGRISTLTTALKGE
jgi:flagellar basal-body rod protein FlgB